MIYDMIADDFTGEFMQIDNCPLARFANRVLLQNDNEMAVAGSCYIYIDNKENPFHKDYIRTYYVQVSYGNVPGTNMNSRVLREIRHLLEQDPDTKITIDVELQKKEGE